MSTADQARIESVQCISPDGLHRMAYKDWGDVENPNILVCVHGVTRVSDDFDDLARELVKDFRIICPDVVGRGRSDWLRSANLYQVPQYVCDMVTLLARLNSQSISYLGTSMGGMIGIALASLPNNPIDQLILNDIGPEMNIDALQQIASYIAQDVRFATFDEAIQYFKSVSLGFGEHTEQQWHQLASRIFRQDKDGGWKRHYDLKIAVPMQQIITVEAINALQATMWAQYDAIHCPTLLLRGVDSALFLKDTARQMAERGPKAHLVEFEKVGHAPTLMHTDQIAVVKEFLSR